MTDDNSTSNAPPSVPVVRAGGWSRGLAIAVIGLAAVGGIGVASALSNDSGERPMHMGWHRDKDGDGMGWRPGGFGFMRMIDRLDLTDAQQDKIWDIADGVRHESRPLFRELRGTRQELTTLLSAPTIDHAAVEALRAKRIADVDKASKTLTDGLVAAAEVLTPEQRTKLVEDMKDAHRPHGRW